MKRIELRTVHEINNFVWRESVILQKNLMKSRSRRVTPLNRLFPSPLPYTARREVLNLLLQRLLLEFGHVELLVQISHERRLHHEVADDGEQPEEEGGESNCSSLLVSRNVREILPGEPQRCADQQHEDAEERDAGVKEGQVTVHVEQPVDGVRVEVDERRQDVPVTSKEHIFHVMLTDIAEILHHSQHCEGEQQQCNHRLFGPGHQPLRK